MEKEDISLHIFCRVLDNVVHPCFVAQLNVACAQLNAHNKTP